MPQVSVVAFRQKGEPVRVAVHAVARWMRNIFENYHPDIVCAEAYRARVGHREHGWIRDEQLLMAGAVQAVTACYGAKFESVSALTARKHFCGRGFDPGGDSKGMVIARAKLLGYDVGNDDAKADACCVWDYAASEYGRKAPAFQLVPQ